MTEFICPILAETRGNKCRLIECPFHSFKNANGCWHGEEITVRVISGHKGITQATIKRELLETDIKLKQWVAFYAYAQWCSDAQPTEEDIKAWNKRKSRLPMSIPIFGFVTVERFARMRQPKVLAEYEKHLNSNINLRKLLEI